MANSSVADKPNTQFGVATYHEDSFDWSAYDAIRPRYSEALFDQLFMYHEKHGGNWQLACDFGTGTGTILAPLMARFEKVIGSDSSDVQLLLARQRFSRQIEAGKLEIVTEAAGAEHSVVPDAGADLFVAAEAAHWFNRPSWYNQAARKLRKGGTLAFWFYSTKPYIASHPEAEASWSKIHTFCMRLPTSKIHDNPNVLTASIIDHTVFRNIANPPEETFGITERHMFDFTSQDKAKYIPANGREYLHYVQKHFPNVDLDNSNVSSSKFVSHNAPEGQASHHVERNWSVDQLMTYLVSLGVQGFTGKEPELASLRGELERQIGGPDVKVDVAWPLQMMICTKQ